MRRQCGAERERSGPGGRLRGLDGGQDAGQAVAVLLRERGQPGDVQSLPIHQRPARSGRRRDHLQGATWSLIHGGSR